MKVITKKELMENIASEWKNVHFVNGDWFNNYAKEVYDKLNIPSLTKEEINKITDDTIWTELICDLCGEDKDFLVSVENREVDMDLHICKDCVKMASGLLEDL